MAKAIEDPKVSNTKDLSKSPSLPKIKGGEADFGRFEISSAPNNPAPGGQASVDNHDDGLNMRSPKFWLAAGAIILVLFAVFLTASYLQNKRKSPTTGENTPASITPASKVPEASFNKLPAVTEQKESDVNILRDYFKGVSVNFKEDLMPLVPAAALELYKNYKAAGGDAKVEAARNFYIFLNNPGSASNEQYIKMIDDVKSDLEKAVGKPLF